MAETAEKFEFQAEVKQVLDIVIHSLYEKREVFLRELISNASDALDKRRFAALTDSSLGSGTEEYALTLEPDSEKRTLTIRDNGIGMSREDLVSSLGTIAKSGTQEFLRAVRAAKGKEASPELIGQFGVGFYSAFMAADTVTVTTRKAGEDKGWIWRSQAEGSFTIEEASGTVPTGTAIALSLKKKEEVEADFTDPAALRAVVKRYSDYITFPVMLSGEEEPLNSRKAVWTKPAKEISDEEHKEFYKHLTHDWTDPHSWLRFSTEGASLGYDALLYVPSKAGMDMLQPERRGGVHLFVKRVLIQEDCKELTPDYLRFVRGVVDCPDIALNISRETMQHDRRIVAIRERVVKKVFDHLEEIKRDDAERYEAFWNEFGRVLKEGLYVGDDTADRIKKLMLFETTWTEAGKRTSFADYVSRMPEEQKDVYFLTGESRSALEASPHLEALRAKGFEVILFTDPVDEVVVDRITEFEGKALRSALRGDLGLEAGKEEREKKQKELKPLLESLKESLSEWVEEVRFSDRLTESAVCLVAGSDGMSARLEKMLKAHQQDAPASKRVLELNPKHPVVERLRALHEQDPKSSKLGDYAYLLYGQGALTEGTPLPDPARYAKLVAELMT
jgi:molecular chaperone HtpG